MVSLRSLRVEYSRFSQRVLDICNSGIAIDRTLRDSTTMLRVQGTPS